MSKIIFVTSENCELCSKALKKIKPLTYFLPMTIVDVSDGYDEYLLRIPVLLKNEEVIDVTLNKLHVELKGKWICGKKTYSRFVKDDQSLSFHNLGQPGPGCSSQGSRGRH